MFAERRDILTEARTRLRQRFLAADVGITGANFLIAETGCNVIVTNEGNARSEPDAAARAHRARQHREGRADAGGCGPLLRLLARSATGQDFSVYTTFTTGPRRAEDADGPDEYHVVLVDNGRSAHARHPFQDMLRCIRCAACLNHCPVYSTIGGHAYGWVYSGPMGSVLTPALIGVDEAGNLPNASTFCGSCESVCPMKIPLPTMMRSLARARVRAPPDAHQRCAPILALWAWFVRRPAPIAWRPRGRLGRSV